MFDFGEGWRFQYQVLWKEAEDLEFPKPIREVGKASLQYSDHDEKE